MEKTMDKIVQVAKGKRNLYIRAQKFTEVLQIHGIMETWE